MHGASWQIYPEELDRKLPEAREFGPQTPKDQMVQQVTTAKTADTPEMNNHWKIRVENFLTERREVLLPLNHIESHGERHPSITISVGRIITGCQTP